MLIKSWETKKVKLSDVLEQPNNPREISSQALSGLKASIGRFGLVELIVWNERTKFIVSGHQRYRILKDKGVKEVDMIVVDMSPEDELAASLTMNNPKIEGEFDDPIMDLFNTIENASPELFETLSMSELKENLERGIERNSGLNNKDDEEIDNDKDVLDSDWDTECPCCGRKWKILPKDIIMTRGIE